MICPSTIMCSLLTNLTKSKILFCSLVIFILFGFPLWSIAGTEPVAKVAVDGGDSSGGGGDTALPDLFSGAMSYQIPIEVPAGRNGMDPGIAIKYRSSNGNGWVGVGWDLELGSIQRAVKNGVDYSGDSYQFKTNNSISDIVNVGNSEYLALVESKFSRIRKLIAVDNRPYWEITDKTGTRFFFGQSSVSRQDDPANAARIYKWCLDRVEDTNGNYMTISYTKDRGEIYPNQIDYIGNSTLGIATSNYVKFYLEGRSDVPDLYKTDFKIKTAYRLKTIDVFAANTRWKTYSLSYTSSANTYQSILANVQPFGKDATVTNGAVTGGTALPAMVFGASTSNNTFGGDSSWSANPLPNSWSTFWLKDVNGDGKVDLVYLNQAGTYINVKLSTGSGFADATSWCTNPLPNSWSMFWLVDVNGDGKVDLVYLNQAGTNINVKLSTGSGFADATSWSANPLPNSWSKFWFADVTGKGKSDIIYMNSFDTELHILKNLSQYDLLTSLTNGTGETVAVGYTPSTNYNNTQLPFPIQTVSLITTNDGYGNVSTTNYTYSGGYFHIGERDFRGFNYAKETGSTGPNSEQKVTETWFHQGNDTDVDVNIPNVSVGYMKGKPYRTRTSDSSGNKYSETTMDYAPDTNGAPYFTPPHQVDSYTYDGDADYTQTRTIFSYDGYGNVVREDHYGDVNDSTDDSTIDRTIVRTFSPNTSNWIIGLPASEDIYEGIGTTSKIAGKTYYYDDLTACNGSPTNNQTPVYGKLTRVAMWLNGGTNPEARMAYNSFGNLICQSDAKGNTTTIAYDMSNTFPTIVTNPLGQQTVNQYYGVDSVPADKGLYGQIKNVTDPNNATTASEYDVFGRKTKETLPDGTWTSITYNNFGTVGTQNVRKDNSAGLWKATYFDGLGRTIKEKSSGSDQKTVVSDTIYNATGTVKQTSLPYFDGLETPRYQTYTYDPLGRVTRQNNPDATFNLACYNDGVTVKIDANGHKKREVRDVQGRLVKVQEYTGSFSACTTDVGVPYATTQYTYDVLGKLRFLTDAKGNQTEMRYDTLGRKYFMSDPDMGVWSYGYDANSNLSTQIDAKGQAITFGYDTLNRLITKHYPSGTDVTLTYDQPTSSYSKGRLSKMIDGSGSTIYNYDKMGRVISSNKTIAGVTYQLPSKDYVNGRLNSITYPDNETVTYGYDGAGNLASAGGYVSYSNFNALGQPRTATFGNGVVTTYQYDAVNSRLKGITTVKGGTSLFSLIYGYDNFGNINGIGNVLNATRSQAFTYDELNRLKQSINSAYGTFTYSYDQIGNILAKEGVSYTYGSRPHAVATLSSGKVYSYDANGNITSDGSRSIAYDYDNMPTLIGNASFTYDGTGTRVKKTSLCGTTIYVDKTYECTNGNCTKYIFAGEQRVALKSGAVVLYYHSDHLGGTSVVTDAAGILAEDIVYYPFGGTRSDDGPGTVKTNVSHKYTSQELDSETGLYNYNARIYDPGLGRFLTPDTIVPDPNNPQSLNRYSYVMNNPLMYTDPSGHRGFWEHLWNSLVEAFTHPNGGVSVSVTYSTGGTSNVSPTNSASGTSGTGGNSGTSGSSSPSISIDAGPSDSGGSLSSGSVNSGMSIDIYKNGGWVSADGINLQLLNSFQKSEGSSSGYSSGGQLSLYLDNSVMGSNMATNGLTGGFAFETVNGAGSTWGAGAARSEGRGVYLGLNNGNIEYGLYSYKTKSNDIMGGRFGYGFSVGYYNTSANNMFDGESLYGALTVSPLLSTSTSYSNDGKQMGYFYGFCGKGPGVAWENGTSIGKIAPIR